MKFHTRLTSPEIVCALRRAQTRGLIARDLTLTVFEPGPSMTHTNSFEIQLGTYDRNSLPAGYTDQYNRALRVRRARNSSRGSAPYAATWHEWGWLIAELFAADPGSRWGTNPARSRNPRPWGYSSPEDFHAKTDGQFRTGQPEPGDIMTTLHAFREDGTEVLPGETVTMTGMNHTFNAATRVSNDAGTDGLIAIDGYAEMFSAPYGLTVRAVRSEDPPPIGQDPDHCETCLAYDGSPPGPEPETWVFVWNRELSPGAAAGQPEATPATLDAALTAVNDNRAGLLDAQRDLPENGASSERDAYLGALENLADAVRAQLGPAPDADELAAEADRTARTSAPPVPGVTQNTGHTVYAVMRTNHVPGEPLDDEWVIAAANDREHVTWTARTCEGGTLAYDTGHYHAGGEGSGSEAEALIDLANRAGVFRMLTDLSYGTPARAAFQDSHARVLDELAVHCGVGRARVRSGLMEAAALGYARISWHAGSRRQDYGIRYDRVGCVFTWARAN